MLDCGLRMMYASGDKCRSGLFSLLRQVPLMPPAPTQYPGIPPGMPPGAYGAVMPAGDMSSLNSGVRNMSVDENGSYLRQPQQQGAPAEPLPGVMPQHYAAQQYAAQYGTNQNLLRSNSYQ